MTDRYADGKPVPDERHSAQGIVGKEADRYASWLLLQLGEQGRPVEQVAQFLASMWVTGGGDTEEIMNDCRKIATRIVYLLEHDEAIWPHLLPGGSQGDPLEHPDTKHLYHILNILGSEPDGDLGEAMDRLNEYLKDEGLVTEPGGRDDSNMYGSFTIVQEELPHGGDIVADDEGGLWHWWTRTTGYRLAVGDDGVGATVEIHANDVKKIDGSEVHELLN